MKFGVGQSPKRIEDVRLLTGRGAYTDDLAVTGALHGYVLRSPVAHAEITAINVEAAQGAPGVVTVLIGANLEADGIGDIQSMTSVKNHDGSDIHTTPWPILAKDRVRFVGNPVAFIVAETLDQARDAAEMVAIEYNELAVAVDTFGAAQEGAAQIWGHIPGNVAFDYAQGDKGAVDAIFDKAERVSKLRLVNNRLICNAMEPRAAIAMHEGDRIRLHLPSQGPFFHFNQLMGMFRIGPEVLRVTTGNVGGGFGTKAFLYPEPCLAFWAAKRLGRDVRWNGDRSEIFLSDVHGRDNVTIAELAMDAEGHFQAMRATTYGAMGAYLSNFGPLIPTDAAVGMYTGLYKIPKAYVNVKGVLTNTVPVDAYRGAGRPEAAYLIERLVDVTARQMGISAVELRRRNFPTPDEMPHTMGLGDVIDSGDFPGLMTTALTEADAGGFEARRAASAASGKLRGLGVATYVERCAGGSMAAAKLRFNEDDTVSMLMGTMDSGQGHDVAYRQILSEHLGVDADLMDMVQGDTDVTPVGFTGGSKSIPVGGASLMFAADKVIARGKELAAHLLETAEADIAYGDGTFSVVGTDRSVGLFEVARAARDPAKLPDGMAPGLDADHDHTAEAPTFPNGCHTCEIEVDPETGQIEILNYRVVDDFGVALNPMLLEGQVHGGISQGLGQAWTEHTAYDADGQLLSGSYMDYQMPRAGDFPSISFDLANTRCTTNPLGVKGAGEAGAIGAPPAFVSAVVDALHERTGLTHLDMPLTPQKVWEALRA